MIETQERAPTRLIPLTEVARALSTQPRTVEVYAARFGISLTEFSRKHRGLTEENYRLLIERATKREAA